MKLKINQKKLCYDRTEYNLSDLAMACMQQRDMLMKDEEEALVCKVVSIPLSRSLVFSSSSICRGTRFNSSLIWGRYRAALVRISTSCRGKQTTRQAISLLVKLCTSQRPWTPTLMFSLILTDYLSSGWMHRPTFLDSSRSVRAGQHQHCTGHWHTKHTLYWTEPFLLPWQNSWTDWQL